MDNKEKILNILARLGPSNPATISKEIKQNTLMTSTFLSVLTSEGKVKISNVKFGSSPFYYLPIHRGRLEGLSKHLNEKDRRAFELLRHDKVLRENELDPLTRVSIQNIKDYAIVLKINFKGESLTFWRYFLVSQEEAVEILKKKYFPSQKVEKRIENSNAIEHKKNQRDKQKEEQKIEQKKKQKDQQKNEQKIEQRKEQKDQQKDKQKVEQRKEQKEKFETNHVNQKKHEKQTSFENKKDIIEIKDELIKKIKVKFYSMDIKIIDLHCNRKNSDYDLQVLVSSAVGELEFYCKLKSKKSINDGDLSSAYIIGETKKLPVLFVTTGKLTKKAEVMYKEKFKNNFTVLNF